MATKGWHGCCDCCIIHSDNFDRADSDSMDTAQWDEYAGDCDIVSNHASLVSDDTVVISKLYDRSAELDGQVVRGVVNCNETGVEVRMIGGAVVGEATDRWWYAQYEQTNATGGTLSLYHYESGTGHTRHGEDIAVPASQGSDVTLSLCLVPENRTSGNGIATATVEYASTAYRTQSATVALPTHEKVGFGCGTAPATAGNLTVDDWEGRRSSMDDTIDDCEDCAGQGGTSNCDACDGGTAPTYVLMDFNGIRTGGNCCGSDDTSGLNTSHIGFFGTTTTSCVGAIPTSDCYWTSPGQVGCSDGGNPPEWGYGDKQACLELTYNSGPNTTSVSVKLVANGVHITFTDTISGKPDCNAWDGYSPSAASDDGNCDYSSASVSITAL